MKLSIARHQTIHSKYKAVHFNYIFRVVTTSFVHNRQQREMRKNHIILFFLFSFIRNTHIYISFYLLIFKVIFHVSFFVTRSSTHNSADLHVPVCDERRTYSLAYAGNLTGYIHSTHLAMYSHSPRSVPIQYVYILYRIQLTLALRYLFCVNCIQKNYLDIFHGDLFLLLCSFNI